MYTRRYMEDLILSYDKKDFKGYMQRAKKKAAEQNKDLEVYLAEQSNIVKRMLIGNHEERIEVLKNTISKDDDAFQEDKSPALT